AGTRLEASRIAFSADHLSRGLVLSCETGTNEDATDAARELTEGLGQLCIWSLLEAVRSHAILDALLTRVIETPSLWSLVANLGVDVRCEPDFASARRVGRVALPTEGEPEPPAEAWELPCKLLVNGALGASCVLLVTKPRSPVHLAGGILRVTAEHPKGHARLVVELLAARAGRTTSTD
ncbi:MAG: hypothetical protein KDC95_22240, partial [Planctomycetes bacterium]|nr:hypothetical protein [Planctomycetota bacterium]